jgi:hypothetical protein
MIEKGALRRGGSYRLLILPHSIALSDAEVKAIEDFSARGGIVIADTTPGLYDEHGRRLATTRFAALFRSGRAIELAPGQPHVNDDTDPPMSLAADDVARFGGVLARVGISSEIRVRDDRDTLPTDIAIHSYRNGNVNLLALQRDFPIATAEPISVQLPRHAYVYDVRAGSFLGHKRELRLTLDRTVPTVLALSPLPLPRPSLTIPRSAHPGEKVRLVLRLTGALQSTVHILHLAVSDSTGRTVGGFSSNVVMRHRKALIHLPIPQGSAGTWTIEAIDVMSGERARGTLDVAGQE